MSEKSCQECGHPMMSGPLEVRNPSDPDGPRITATWWCANCHHSIPAPVMRQDTAADRVERYLANRPTHGIDPQEVHSVHVGTDREACLTADDLADLVALARAATLALHQCGPGPIRDHEMWNHHEGCVPLEKCVCGLIAFRQALRAITADS